MCHLCDRNRGEGGAGGSSTLLSIERGEVAPEPEQPIRTVYLLYYLGCLGVMWCILGSPTVSLLPTIVKMARRNHSR